MGNGTAMNQKTSNHRLQATFRTPLRSVQAAPEPKRHALHMNIFRALIICITILLPASHIRAAENDSSKCTASCAALKAKLATLDCNSALAEISSLLISNRSIVLEFPEAIRKRRNSVAEFEASVAVASRVTQNCLVNNAKSKSPLINVLVTINEFHYYVSHWLNEAPKVPLALEKQYHDRLIRGHTKTIEAISIARQGI